MEPTLRDGDWIWVDPSLRRRRMLRRGDLIVFRDPDDANRWLVKRVAALSPERILLGPDGIARAPPGDFRTLPGGSHRYIEQLRIPVGHVVVLSDNGRAGRDSRRFGPVPRRSIAGVVWSIRPKPTRRTRSRIG